VVAAAHGIEGFQMDVAGFDGCHFSAWNLLQLDSDNSIE
jgi:hypothetical protein